MTVYVRLLIRVDVAAQNHKIAVRVRLLNDATGRILGQPVTFSGKRAFSGKAHAPRVLGQPDESPGKGQLAGRFLTAGRCGVRLIGQFR
jgi:hypothetical protein